MAARDTALGPLAGLPDEWNCHVRIRQPGGGTGGVLGSKGRVTVHDPVGTEQREALARELDRLINEHRPACLVAALGPAAGTAAAVSVVLCLYRHRADTGVVMAVATPPAIPPPPTPYATCGLRSAVRQRATRPPGGRASPRQRECGRARPGRRAWLGERDGRHRCVRIKGGLVPARVRPGRQYRVIRPQPHRQSVSSSPRSPSAGP